MRLDLKEEKRYQRHMRDDYDCAVNSRVCCRPIVVTKLNHDEESWIGNSITLCRRHATGDYETSLASLGRKDFEALFELDLAAIAEWCNWDFDGQLAFGEAPKGVNYPKGAQP